MVSKNGLLNKRVVEEIKTAKKYEKDITKYIKTLCKKYNGALMGLKYKEQQEPTRSLRDPQRSPRRGSLEILRRLMRSRGTFGKVFGGQNGVQNRITLI